MKILILLLLLFISICEINSKILPDYIPICTRKEKDYGKCVQDAIDTLRPYIRKGIGKLKVPSNSPLILPQITVDRYQELFVMKILISNIRIYHLNDFRNKNFKIDLNKYEGSFQLTYPKVHVLLDYDVAGTFITIPVYGKGKFEGNYTKCELYGKGSGKVVERNGTEYMNLDKVSSRVVTGDGHIKLVGEPPYTFLAETATQFINANMRLALDVFRPLAEELHDILFVAIGNRILDTIPLAELIPDE